MYHGRPGALASRMIRAAELLEARPDLAEVLPDLERSFSVRITRSFWERLDPRDPNDPLARQVVPDPAELVDHPDDLADPVGDAACSPLPWVVHKYPSRVLLLATKRCHLYCRYCFRRTHHPTDALDPTPAEWSQALDYATRSGASEVILSGGDPLVLRDDALLATLRALRSTPVIRIHTRAPITFPERITPDLVDGLRGAAPLWVVVHCNHARELAPDVDVALARMVDAGIPVLNQAVLLRGVNDDVDTLVELSEALVRRRVFPYYLHVTDRVSGNAHLRVSMEASAELHRRLQARVSGIALPRLVFDPPEGTGKVDVRAQAGYAP